MKISLLEAVRCLRMSRNNIFWKAFWPKWYGGTSSAGSHIGVRFQEPLIEFSSFAAKGQWFWAGIEVPKGIELVNKVACL